MQCESNFILIAIISAHSSVNCLSLLLQHRFSQLCTSKHSIGQSVLDKHCATTTDDAFVLRLVQWRCTNLQSLNTCFNIHRCDKQKENVFDEIASVINWTSFLELKLHEQLLKDRQLQKSYAMRSLFHTVTLPTSIGSNIPP